MNSPDLIVRMHQRIVEVFEKLVPREPRCAFLDFPNHPNVGDSAIWLGEKKMLETIGAKIVYECDLLTYSRAVLADRIGDGIIFLHGGGNFGDVWPKRQLFRERVIEAFPRNQIVIFPQTIFFQKPENLRRAQAVLNKHPKLVILARDQRSLELANKEFTATSALCPDMAFMLGTLARSIPPKKEILWLARSDVEARGEFSPRGDSSVFVADWLQEPKRIMQEVYDRFSGAMARHPRAFKGLTNPLRALLVRLAANRVARGTRMLSSGRVVITDRLHAHILSLLLGIPHVVLDNNYGKLKDFYDTWTVGCERAFWAESGDDALEHARLLAKSV
jgi:exopolysaccharide biosynthesis protein PssK